MDFSTRERSPLRLDDREREVKEEEVIVPEVEKDKYQRAPKEKPEKKEEEFGLEIPKVKVSGA
jgi:hypothetical protein